MKAPRKSVEQLFVLIQAVAAELGGTASQREGFCYLLVDVAGVRPYQIQFTQDYSQSITGRMTVRDGIVCRDRAGEHVHLPDAMKAQRSITVSSDRSPAAIAADIKKRLLPATDRVAELVAVQIAEMNAALDVQAQAAEKLVSLATAAGLEISPARDSAARFYVRGISRVDVSISGLVALDLGFQYVSPETAVAMMKLLECAS